MYKENSKNGFSLKAYRGSQMTLLSMNLEKKPEEGTFAGFTLFYINPKGERKAIQNMLNFEGREGVTNSDISPIQRFNWVHFPGSYQQTGMLSGNYSYEATPRYFGSDRKLLPLDETMTVRVSDMIVDDFNDGKVNVGFTRAFVKSQAFSNRYGAKQKLIPTGDWIFDTNKKAGINPKYGDFTYEDMYAWLGFNARTMIYSLLKEALNTPSVSVDMFAYDFNDPVIADLCLQLASQGKIRIILDNAALHTQPDKKGNPTRENDFEARFNAMAKNGSEIFRCRFARFSHCKEIILKKNDKAYKVLTGSTNFSYTGLYVNANHVLMFEDKKVAQYYEDVFNACWHNGKAAPFRATGFANNVEIFSGKNTLNTEINVSPHTPDYAKKLIDSITEVVNDSKNTSVLFSVMEMGEKTTGSLIPALRELHKDDSIFTYGITDNSNGEISLYKPGYKNGLLIDAKKANRELPPPFKKEFELGLMHAIHHKFVVTNFNKENARVYCGSSNLALGGEQDNGDNLLCIKDQDVATVFAIEALRLTDHFNFRSVTEKQDAGVEKTAKLDSTGIWVDKFYNEQDIRYVERMLFA